MLSFFTVNVLIPLDQPGSIFTPDILPLPLENVIFKLALSSEMSFPVPNIYVVKYAKVTDKTTTNKLPNIIINSFFFI